MFKNRIGMMKSGKWQRIVRLGSFAIVLPVVAAMVFVLFEGCDKPTNAASQGGGESGDEQQTSSSAADPIFYYLDRLKWEGGGETKSEFTTYAGFEKKDPILVDETYSSQTEITIFDTTEVYQKGIAIKAPGQILIDLTDSNAEIVSFEAIVGYDGHLKNPDNPPPDEVRIASVQVLFDDDEVHNTGIFKRHVPHKHVLKNIKKSDGSTAKEFRIISNSEEDPRDDQIVLANAGLWIMGDPPLNPEVENSTDLTFDSSNTNLNTHFVRRKNEIFNRLVKTGRTSLYIPSYEAALPKRGAFCLRDVAHMAIGAHYLGLNEETFSMYKAYAELGAWMDGSDLRMPFHITFRKVRVDGNVQLPAIYHYVKSGYDLYRLTGEERWITEPVLIELYDDIMDDFLKAYDHYPTKTSERSKGNGIVDVERGGGDSITATLFEQELGFGTRSHESADSIGMQYQAMLAYAEMIKVRKEPTGGGYTSNEWRKKADDLRAAFEEDFKIPVTEKDEQVKSRVYYRGRQWDPKKGADGGWVYFSDYGREPSILMGLTFLISDANRDAYLKYIWGEVKGSHGTSANAPIHKDGRIRRVSNNQESRTYVPEVFYPYGETDKGWHRLKHNLTKKSVYPEIPFTVVDHFVRFVLGVDREPDGTIKTLPQLDMKDMTYLGMGNIPIGKNIIKVKHDGNERTTFTNQEGPAISWIIQFYGRHSTIEVDDESLDATIKDLHDKDVSRVLVQVAPGQTKVATVAAP